MKNSNRCSYYIFSDISTVISIEQRNIDTPCLKSKLKIYLASVHLALSRHYNVGTALLKSGQHNEVML